jgi:transposase
MPAFVIPNRSQRLLLTQFDLESAAPEGSVVRLINDLVDSLDTSAIESEYAVESRDGRPPIHPKTFLKVALFALHNCRFSLRKMEDDSAFNLAYQWLTGARVIDHSTMGQFLSRFGEQIVALFSQVVTACREQGLIEFDLLAIDSLKVRASANYKQSKNLAGVEKEEEKIGERLKEILQTATDEESAAAAEVRTLSRRKERVEAAKAKLLARISEKSRAASEQQRAALTEKEKVNITDPDSTIMQQANGEKNPAYSVTTTTDTANDIVTHFQVNVGDNDPAALTVAIEGSRQSTGERHEEVVADAGFASMENYQKLHDDLQKAMVPDRRIEIEERGEVGEYDRSKFNYKEKSDTYRCPQGALLKNVDSVEINGRNCDCYENREACASCPVREKCTSGSFRRIVRDEREELREAMRSKLARKGVRSRYNLRAHSAESPFGHIKANLKFRTVMRRGYEKVRMEMALLFMLHNGMRMARATI